MNEEDAMAATTTGLRVNIFPGLTYGDAPAAMDWLEKAFGFEKVLAVEDGKGGISHAELRFGGGWIMLGSPNMPGSKSPRDLGGYSQSIYVFVEDDQLAAHYERAKGAGAAITRELERKDYGGSGYSARDLEGHEWSFGSYYPGS
jgi:uncharacterized glyoxalase superfamily protein PhnB